MQPDNAYTLDGATAQALKLAANHLKLRQKTFKLQTVEKSNFLQMPGHLGLIARPLGFHTPAQRCHAAAAKPPAASAGSRRAAPALALQLEPLSSGVMVLPAAQLGYPPERILAHPL